MDEAAKGAAALRSGDIAAAVSHYNKAIAANKRAVNYYIKRSTAYTRLSPADHNAALQDAEIALVLAKNRQKRELIAEAQQRRGISYFHLGKYADAKQCFLWSKAFDLKSNGTAVWLAKVETKVEEDLAPSVEEFPKIDVPALPEKEKHPEGNSTAQDSQATLSEADGVSFEQESNGKPKENVDQTIPSKVRHEWFQSDDTIGVSVFVRGVPKNEASVSIEPMSLNISFPMVNGSDFQYTIDTLFADIDPQLSSYKIMSTKVEFSLRKAAPGVKWKSLGGSEVTMAEDTPRESGSLMEHSLVPNINPGAPAYPTSSKSGPKNWDKLASDLGKKSRADSKGGKAQDNGTDEDYESEGVDSADNFFKSLFAGADPDTQRAMKKSFLESNGTALSTNWEEVAKGQVETHPPDGMEAKKWGE